MNLQHWQEQRWPQGISPHFDSPSLRINKQFQKIHQLMIQSGNQMKNYHDEMVFLATSKLNLLQEFRIFHPSWNPHPHPYHLYWCSWSRTEYINISNKPENRTWDYVRTLRGGEEVRDVQNVLHIGMAFLELFNRPMNPIQVPQSKQNPTQKF